MAVKLRLKRVGKKKQPYYRIVAADIRSPRDGRFIDTIGFYNPSGKTDEEKLKISKEKLDDWIKKGAEPTKIVKNLIKKVA